MYYGSSHARASYTKCSEYDYFPLKHGGAMIKRKNSNFGKPRCYLINKYINDNKRRKIIYFNNKYYTIISDELPMYKIMHNDFRRTRTRNRILTTRGHSRYDHAIYLSRDRSRTAHAHTVQTVSDEITSDPEPGGPTPYRVHVRTTTMTTIWGTAVSDRKEKKKNSLVHTYVSKPRWRETGVRYVISTRTTAAGRRERAGGGGTEEREKWEPKSSCRRR